MSRSGRFTAATVMTCVDVPVAAVWLGAGALVLFALAFAAVARAVGESSPFFEFAFVVVLVNIALALFNLMPVPPLVAPSAVAISSATKCEVDDACRPLVNQTGG